MPNYREINNRSSMRNHFSCRAAWMWIKLHKPEIAETIRAEAYKRYPPIKGQKKANPKTQDYSFLEK